LILVIEDLDRNESPTFNFDDISATLLRIKHIKNISVLELTQAVIEKLKNNFESKYPFEVLQKRWYPNFCLQESFPNPPHQNEHPQWKILSEEW
jgi:hypothetical protein